MSKGNDIFNKQTKESYEKAKICYISIRKFKRKYANDKDFQKVNDHCHYTGKYQGEAHFICSLGCSIPNEIPVASHNRFNYDYRFIIEKLAKEVVGQFNCLGDNTEKI